MWQVYYTEIGKVMRQMITVRAETIYEAMQSAEVHLKGKDIAFLAAVQRPLKLELGER